MKGRAYGNPLTKIADWNFRNLHYLNPLTSARQEHPEDKVVERLQIKLKNESQHINNIFKTSIAFKTSKRLQKYVKISNKGFKTPSDKVIPKPT